MNYFHKGNHVDLVHGRWTTAGSHSPPCIGGGADRRTLGHGGALVRARPPATPGHGSSPAREEKRGEHGGPFSGLTGARATVWWLGDDDEATVEDELGSGSAQASGEEGKRGGGCGEN
jgi:hypothetical protein